MRSRSSSSLLRRPSAAPLQQLVQPRCKPALAAKLAENNLAGTVAFQPNWVPKVTLQTDNLADAGLGWEQVTQRAGWAPSTAQVVNVRFFRDSQKT